jgi:predicted PurR-regulated permease PerM
LDPPDASSDQAGISSRDEECLLARRFILNPVLVIISLVFWFWMWGAPGAILSVPMLAITKIICDRLRPLAAFGHFLEG